MKYDLTGQRFGKLLVSKRDLHEKSGNMEWGCLCDCGVYKVVPSGSLRNGTAKSCGCAQNDRPRVDITGNRYGRLLITGFIRRVPTRNTLWAALCDCGKQVEVRKSNLWVSKTGAVNTMSCGCHRRDYQRKRREVHGELTDSAGKRTKEYGCWTGMKGRCYNPNNSRYKSYGGAGVTVCKDWRESFALFLADVGRTPEGKPHIDRICPYGNYEPGNVRWASLELSNRNKRASHEPCKRNGPGWCH